ncbi:MAG: EAL domain-containing protein [Gomphosphaeria aponina SAG 52.96 = DSM 107014]|uniref:EAL domain-containing protein n=1 Tax=Gomphosphaeria aponina SAG 52.96 = DSM 107014 TaxID=1521640 RepID=A0A941GNH0_9CHRO|nr:EAL domain-containing protein [Gomphosphaeria aponina SAG 52.96 = DSM 107014]
MSNLQPFRHLLVIEDKKGRRIIPLEESTYTLGRDSRNSIVIYDYQVSRSHATLIRKNDYESDSYSYRIIDGDLQGARSTNGLMINGKNYLSHDLKHGDIINFGGKAKAIYQIVSNAAGQDLFQDPEDKTRISSTKTSITEEAKKTIISTEDLEEVSREKDRIRLASFPELSPNPIIEIDWSGKITYLNPAATAKFKTIHQAKLEHPILEGLLKQSPNRQGSLFVREIKIGNEVFEQYVHYLAESKLIRSYIFDFTKRKQMEIALRESEEKYKAVVRQASEGIFLVNAGTKKIIEANKSYCNLLGYTGEEILQLTLYDVVAENRELVERDLERLLTEKLDFVREERHLTKEGTRVNVEVSLSLITYGGGEIFCFVVRDITQRKRSEETLQYQANHDIVTELPNRILFNEQMIVALANAQRNRNLMAVMFVELEEFRKISDRLSYAIADQLLKEFAKRLKSCSRMGDTVARWGGEEFMILLPRIYNPNDAAKIGKKIIDAANQPFNLDQQKIQLGCNIGIAIYPNDAEEKDTLLSYADTALANAKKTGSNNLGFYNSKLSSQNTKLLRLENLLTHALEEKQFFLVYQPQVNIKDGRIVALEALLRWQHPELGEITAEQFIPLAEETNMIVSISQWILETAIAQNQTWQKTDLPKLPVTVNLSPKQFQQANLVTMLKEIFKATELQTKYLEIEITEAALTENINFAKKTLSELGEMGVKIALDDFGKGNSALSHLQEFSFNTLKINQELVLELTDKPKDIATISALITLGRGFQMRVVAEGVEKMEQFQLLRRLRCEQMQGYLLSEPLSVEAATNLLEIGSLTIPS